ncbi:MAG: amidase family protein, partial [Comamonas sp.]
GEAPRPLPPRAIAGLRLGIPRGLLFTQTEDEVLAAFEHAAGRLRQAGAHVGDDAFDDWLDAPFRLQEQGTLVAAEAAHIHHDALLRQPEAFDPLVRGRIQQGQAITASHYVGVQQARQALLPRADAALAGFDALILPTVPCVAPPIADVRDEASFRSLNALILRNPSVFNFLDLPALSLPLPRPGLLPIGLMVVGPRGADRALLGIGAAIEALLQR